MIGYETILSRALSDQIENLEEEVNVKRKLLEDQNDTLETLKSELEMEEEDMSEEMRKDIDKLKQKTEILEQYLATIVSSDEFRVNALKKEIDNKSNEFINKLKPIHRRGVEIKDEIVKLRELQANCDDLRQKLAQ